MGKKKKAILKFKRDGNLGKYANKFSSLLNATDSDTRKIEIEETKDEISTTDESVTEETKSEDPPKPKRTKRTRKTSTTKNTTTKKQAPTTRKRRPARTKSDS